MKPLLVLDNIHQIFNPNTVNENHVLKGINLSVYPGDFIAVIGGNGAGKSTLLNAIAGSFPLSAGDIFLNGQSIKQATEEERAQYISRVFQDPLKGTAPGMTLAENLNIASHRGERRGLRKSLTAEVKEDFARHLARLNIGLEDRLDEEMATFSGGQRQMIALLMATIKKPEILLLDEHIAALDPSASTQVMDLTEEIITGQDITSLMVTHDMQYALDYGNRLVMLNNGRVVVDLDEEEKSQLEVEDLIDLFKEKKAGLSDSLLG